MRHCGTVTLTTARLTLRRLTAADTESMHANWASDRAVYAHMTSQRMPELSDVQRFIAEKNAAYAQPDFYYWGLIDRSGQCIGMAALTEVHSRKKTANLAYSLGTAWWGQGLAHEAAEAVLRCAFCTVGFQKVYGSHFTDNVRSGYVLRACGMQHTGQSRTPIYHRGTYKHFENYELTARQYAARASASG